MRKYISTLIILGLGLLSVYLLANNTYAEGNGTYPAPLNGDWIIENETNVWNETVILNGNLIIENLGNLTLKNVNLRINSRYSGEYGITVQNGGKLKILDYDNNSMTPIDRSIITKHNNEFRYKFLTNPGSIFEMRNSELTECGFTMGVGGISGLTINSDNAIIENSTLYNNYRGIDIKNSKNNTIANNTIFDNYEGVYLDSSSNNFIYNNSIKSSGWHSLYMSYSDNNIVYLNDISNNEFGILVISSKENKIKYNDIYSNQNYGVFFRDSNENKFQNNTLNSNSYRGIYLENSDLINISGNVVSDNIFGIYMDVSDENQISENNFSNNENGVYIKKSESVTMKTNTILSNSNLGIFLSYSSNINMSKNILINNRYNFGVEGDDLSYYYHDINNSNLINSREIYYLVNKKDSDLGNLSDIGYLALISCTNISVSSLSTSDNLHGILLINTTDSLIEHSTMNFNDYGIRLGSSNNNIFKNINIANNELSILIEKSNNNQLFDIVIESSNTDAIILSNSNNISLTNSSILNSGFYDIFLHLDSNLYFLNTTYNKNNVNIPEENSILNVNWYLNVKLVDENNIPIPYKNIIVENLTEIEIYNSTNKQNGWVRWIICNELIHTNNGISDFSQYTIYAKEDNLIINKTVINVKNDLYLILRPKVYNVLLECDQFEKSTAPNKPITYNIKISNRGTKFDTYILEVNHEGNWLAYLNFYSTNLLSDENRTVILTIQPSENELAGKIVPIHVKAISTHDPDVYSNLKTITTVDFVPEIMVYQKYFEKQIEPGESAIYDLNLKNIGNGDDFLYLQINNTLSNDLDDWDIEIKTDISPLFLEFGKSASTWITITTPMDSIANERKIFSFDIYSLGNNDYLDTIIILSTVNKISNITLKCLENEKSANPSKISYYIINITNNGNAKEIINLKLSGENHFWAYLEKQVIELEKKSSLEIYMKVTIPLDAEYNEQALIEVTAQVDKNIFSIITKTTVERTHDLVCELDTDEKLLYPGESGVFLFIIKNQGNINENFKISVNRTNSKIPENWSIGPEIIIDNLGVGDERFIEFNINTPINALVTQNAEIDFQLVSIISRIQKNYITITRIHQIYDVYLEILEKEKTVNLNETVKYEINVINKGNGMDTLKLELTGLNNNWGYLNEYLLNIKPKDSHKVILSINPPLSSSLGEKAYIKVQGISSNRALSNSITTTTIIRGVENKNPVGDFKIIHNNEEIIEIKIGEILTLEASDSYDDDGKIVNYQWAINNGDIRYGKIINYQYPKETQSGLHKINLKVTDDNGAFNQKEKVIGLNKNIRPVADFKITNKGKIISINQDTIFVETESIIIFDAEKSYDEDSEIVEYRWDFGNGDVVYSKRVEYAYPENNEPGLYQLTLRITDSDGDINEKHIKVKVEKNEEIDITFFILMIIFIVVIFLIILLAKTNKTLKNVKKEQIYQEFDISNKSRKLTNKHSIKLDSNQKSIENNKKYEEKIFEDNIPDITEIPIVPREISISEQESKTEIVNLDESEGLENDIIVSPTNFGISNVDDNKDEELRAMNIGLDKKLINSEKEENENIVQIDGDVIKDSLLSHEKDELESSLGEFLKRKQEIRKPVDDIPELVEQEKSKKKKRQEDWWGEWMDDTEGI